MNDLTAKTDKRIVIDANPYRTRAVLMENGRVVEICSEQRSRESLLGSIYRGRVCSMLPGMSAAFIDIGAEKNAFFSIADLDSPSPAASGADIVEQADGEANTRGGAVKKPRKALRVGQELMVQVVKDAQGSKAARVSTRISLSGHLLVLFPDSELIGISKHITEDADRERLRRLIAANKGEGVGAIVRTAAATRADEDIVAELERLKARWQSIQNAYRISAAPKCLFSEDGLVERTLRDLFRPDVSRITVNDRDCCSRILELVSELEPGAAEKVHFAENAPDLFEQLGIEKQIDEALARRVWLKSGAYIVLDQTEALLSIDVNSGKNIGRSDLRATALATNCEAAGEIARQLRLRNIGGIVIIDFIDLESAEDKQTVVRTLREALANDRTTALVHGMTTLGLVEVTRKKLRENLASSMQRECLCCSGSGRVSTPETVALRIRARALARLFDLEAKRISISAHPSVIALIKQHLPAERRLNAMEEVEVVLNELRGAAMDEFEVRLLSDQ
ncbi:MAG: Rne/Rng family ribonuclease [Clostridia bacterium]|nr:Rne/Rng family ribonuclease [Clostridia bacterium]